MSLLLRLCAFLPQSSARAFLRWLAERQNARLVRQLEARIGTQSENARDLRGFLEENPGPRSAWLARAVSCAMGSAKRLPMSAAGERHWRLAVNATAVAMEMARRTQLRAKGEDLAGTPLLAAVGATAPRCVALSAPLRALLAGPGLAFWQREAAFLMLEVAFSADSDKSLFPQIIGAPWLFWQYGSPTTEHADAVRLKWFFALGCPAEAEKGAAFAASAHRFFADADDAQTPLCLARSLIRSLHCHELASALPSKPFGSEAWSPEILQRAWEWSNRRWLASGRFNDWALFLGCARLAGIALESANLTALASASDRRLFFSRISELAVHADSDTALHAAQRSVIAMAANAWGEHGAAEAALPALNNVVKAELEARLLAGAAQIHKKPPCGCGAGRSDSLGAKRLAHRL